MKKAEVKTPTLFTETRYKYSNNLLNNTLLVIFSISFTAFCFFLMAAFITGINLIIDAL